MRNYIIGRLIRAIVSLFVVVSIAIIMVFMLIPRDRAFSQDSAISKLAGKPDELAIYKNNKLKELGYLDFKTQGDICLEKNGTSACVLENSEEITKFVKEYEADGYITHRFKSGLIYVIKDYSPVELIMNFYSRLISFDTPNYVNDPMNKDLERGISLATDHNGIPAIKCSGCQNRYLLYFDGSFPFIHQNFIKINFGNSYPTFSGVNTFDVISSGQGELKRKSVTFEKGSTSMSALNLHKCKYKMTESLDRLDNSKFTSNYANCDSIRKDPSMISVSYFFGIVALILSYILSIPAGIVMARKKGDIQDKIGTIYINFMIAVPSLAFIYFFKSIGRGFGLPDKFPELGFGNPLSYVLPAIILALMSTSGLMIWVRRYMVDQSSSDYVKFAKAKGLSEKEIFNRHILKNAIIPLINGLPASIILSISGAVITETVFAIPGMGKMLPDSIKAGNNSMIITLTFIFTALSVFSLVAGDVLMAIVDPRIKLSSKGGSR